jgi:tetrahydromethanopterin:alpha-L-glutamate ligase
MRSKLRIGVIGIPGKWSTETLADAVEQRTGYRRVIDMGEVWLDLAHGRLMHREQNLCELDGWNCCASPRRRGCGCSAPR